MQVRSELWGAKWAASPTTVVLLVSDKATASADGKGRNDYLAAHDLHSNGLYRGYCSF